MARPGHLGSHSLKHHVTDHWLSGLVFLLGPWLSSLGPGPVPDDQAEMAWVAPAPAGRCPAY